MNKNGSLLLSKTIVTTRNYSTELDGESPRKVNQEAENHWARLLLFYNMTVSDTTKRKVILSFKSIADLSKFKHECDFNEFYVDRDLITLVGDFIEMQIQVAINRYDASCEYTH